MVYLITYDLNKEDKDYNSLYLALRQYDHTRDSELDSVWFISTALSPNQIYEHLRHQLDVNDRIIVSQMFVGAHQGWMNNDVWAWINARL